jgi:competence protein ComEC
MPALLAGLGNPVPRCPTTLVGPGLARLEGVVGEVQRDPANQRTVLWLGRPRVGMRVFVDGELEVLPGDRVRAMVRTAAAPIAEWPVRPTTSAANVEVEPGSWSVRRGIAALRRRWERLLLQHGGAAGPLLATLVLGDETRPERGIAEAHRGTGLSHLLAVSGAHAAILAELLGLSARKRGSRLRRPRWHLFVVLALLSLYGAVAGGDPPVLRAVLGYALAATAQPLGRRCGLAIALGVPALWTTLQEPTALLGPSFQLSYAAVLGLALAPRLPDRPTWRERLGAAIAASFWAALATAPLTLWWFGQLAPWTILLTPLLAPLVAAMLLGGLLLCLAATLHPLLGDAIGAPLALLVEGYVAMVAAADQLPCTPILATASPALWSALAAAVPAVVWFAWARTRTVAALAGALAAAPHFIPAPRPAGGTLELFAVGHGQAALARLADGSTVAVDCGSMHHPHLAARRLLAALPERRLDRLVVTHADQDHHNGVPLLLDTVAIAEVFLPESLAGTPLERRLSEAGCAVTIVAAGSQARPHQELQLAAPRLPADASDNDRSLWCRIGRADGAVLLTGDAERQGVEAVLSDRLVHEAAVLVLPHHGRENPRITDLLAVVRPWLCLASAPAEDGLTAQGRVAQRAGVATLTTGAVGSIRVRICGPIAVQHDVAWRELPR